MRRTPTQADALLARSRRLLQDHRTRAKKDGAELDYGLPELRRLIEQSPCCRFCRMPVAYDLSLDHLIPISRGGRHAYGNLVVVCRRCNSLKGQMTGSEMDLVIQLLERLHPIARQDVERRMLASGKRYATGRAGKRSGAEADGEPITK